MVVNSERADFCLLIVVDSHNACVILMFDVVIHTITWFGDAHNLQIGNSSITCWGILYKDN